MRRCNTTAPYVVLLGTATALSFMTFAPRAQESAADIAPAMEAADPAEKADVR
jgi:hypothetical protein